MEHGQPQPHLVPEEHNFAVSAVRHTLALRSVLVLPFEDSHHKVGAKSKRKSGDLLRPINVPVLLKIHSHTLTRRERDMRVGVENRYQFHQHFTSSFLHTKVL